MAVVLTALLTAGVLLLVTYALVSLRNLTYWQRLKVPCVRPEILFGNFRNVVMGKETQEEAIETLYRKLDGHRFAGVYQGHSPALLVRDPQLVKELVTKAFEAFPTRAHRECSPGGAQPLLENVFNAEGPVWRELRGRLTPAFTPGRVRRTVGDMQRHADTLTRTLARAVDEAGKGGVDVALKGPLLAYSVDTVSSSLFGLEANAQTHCDSELLKMAELIENDSSAIHEFANGSAPGLLKLWRATASGAAGVHARIASFFLSIAKDVLAARSSTGCEARDFIQLLADARMEEVTNDGDACEWRVGAHVCALLYAGAHKPSALVGCALDEVAKAPRLQQRLRAEADDAAAVDGGSGEGSGDALLSAVEKAPLLDAVVAETLRKYPVEPVLTRVNRLPYVIPDSKLELPTGTRVLLPVSAIQRDAVFYPQPYAFRPQRFLNPDSDLYNDVVTDCEGDQNCDDANSGSGEKSPDALYLPFGAGPRKCIGYRLGLLQTKVAIATMLRHFHFAPGSSPSRPEAPVLRITRRTD